MEPRLILPDKSVMQSVFNEDLYKNNLYFLAGPIKGGGEWQEKAIHLLIKQDPNCVIACPVRYTSEDTVWQYVTPTGDIREKDIDQVRWERMFLDKAARLGCIIFWLPEEDKENPRPKEEGPYAQDTYGELGRWSVVSGLRKRIYYEYGVDDPIIHLAIGAEPNFPGLKTIQKNLDQDHDHPFPIYPSLEATITRAVENARSGKNLVF